jgi:hypothetical protein
MAIAVSVSPSTHDPREGDRFATGVVISLPEGGFSTVPASANDRFKTPCSIVKDDI